MQQRVQPGFLRTRIGEEELLVGGKPFGRYGIEQRVDQQRVARRADAAADEDLAAADDGLAQVAGIVEDDDVLALHGSGCPAVMPPPAHEGEAEAVAPLVYEDALALVERVFHPR